MNANSRALERLGCKLSRRGYYPRFVRAIVWFKDGRGVEIFAKCNWRNYPFREWKMAERGRPYKRVTPEHVLSTLECCDSMYVSKWGKVRDKDRPYKTRGGRPT